MNAGRQELLATMRVRACMLCVCVCVCVCCVYCVACACICVCEHIQILAREKPLSHFKPDYTLSNNDCQIGDGLVVQTTNMQTNKQTNGNANRHMQNNAK